MIPDPPPTTAAPSDDGLDRRIARAIRRARIVAAFEEVWRRLVPILWVGGLYAALAWLGVFAAVSEPLRHALLALVAALLLAALVSAFRDRSGLLAALDAGRALRRIEAVSGLTGHELAGLTDRLAGTPDAATARLWAAHRARLAARVDRLDTGLPHPDLGRRDTWALRPALGLALFVGWFAAGDERLARLAAPLRATAAPTVEDRLDAWIDPPTHTGRAPLVLIAEGRSTLAAGESVPPVPQGSRLVVRAAAARADRPPRPIALATTTRDGRPADPIPPTTEAIPPTAPLERTLTLATDGDVRLARDGETIATWKITVLPDHPPSIHLVGPPEVQISGALKLRHETDDDWGVVSAEARFAPPAAAKGRPLVSPPGFPLALPLRRDHVGAATTIRDVTAHPFAGSTLRLTLHARDAAGQEGASEAIDVRLPERPFRKPLARALVELRRRLALDAGEAPVVVTALDALTLAPERFEEKPATHLGLRFLKQRAAAARDDDALRELIDLLWVAATAIEDGDLADHEKAFRQAQEALAKAIEDGASPEEIARLTRELRAAMERFLAAKAEAGRRQSAPRGERSGAERTIGERDLQRMLDRIEALARTGSREAAEQLLRELRELMENLQSGGGGQSAEGRAGEEMLEQLGEMIRRQQKLMEETHRADRGEAGEDGAGALGRLGDDQKALRDTLRGFSDRATGGSAPRGDRGTGERGTDGRGGSGREGSDGAEDFGDAAEAMGEAGEALGRGEGDTALDAQTRALESLRQGARRLADQMARRGGRAGREGEEGDAEDPLGRPRRGKGSSLSGNVALPEEIDVERARRILDDIRKRLGEPARPKFERDYLDRLLDLDR